MNKKFKPILISLTFIAMLSVFLLYLTTGDVAVLNPKGMVALKERNLIITASLLMLIVVIPVFIITLAFAWKYREDNKEARHEPDWEHNSIAEYCWWGVPMVIVAILAVITWRSSHELNPFRPIENGKKPIEIQVVALEWKWLFIYPDEGIATINYVQFPNDTPINFEITADAPMNSFWIPELGGQIYAMPAMRSKLHLIADKSGTYRGASANISGKGFAGMIFQAESTSKGDYDSWVQSVKSSGKTLDSNTYKELLIPTEYNKVELFSLSDPDLFEQIMAKYMAPQKK